jgi:hypothetical protein
MLEGAAAATLATQSASAAALESLKGILEQIKTAVEAQGKKGWLGRLVTSPDTLRGFHSSLNERVAALTLAAAMTPPAAWASNKAKEDAAAAADASEHVAAIDALGSKDGSALAAEAKEAGVDAAVLKSKLADARVAFSSVVTARGGAGGKGDKGGTANATGGDASNRNVINIMTQAAAVVGDGFASEALKARSEVEAANLELHNIKMQNKNKELEAQQSEIRKLR